MRLALIFWLWPLLLTADELRVVSLAPHLSEWVVALGLGKQLVGAIPPLPAGLVTQAVGGAYGINREVLLVLQPGLVLTWPGGNRAEDLAWIAAHGWRTFAFDSRTRLHAVPARLRELGAVLGAVPQAEALAQNWSGQLDVLQRRYAAVRSVTVLYQVWPEPLLTLNDQHVIGDALQYCGGRNLFGGSPVLAPQISWEAVVAADPEVILVAVDAGQDFAALSAVWRRWPKLQAVRQQRIYPVDANRLHRLGPGLLDGVTQLCEVLDRARRSGGYRLSIDAG